ncbi:DUF3291 domain-containing protein [Conexibacter sp. W3-3-2]|uniref:DUF3291 domain-containing protein n=1 Tax=Conexibacter sp. W3-3-2 TaxID=2675227 RepID=UPI0012B88FA8|nr:DUF3291 domain-containing protein [Conexibacter sp. W3-3-2]MTD43950.1 DUF3291 domain-containing protein [Conexibacter sp. W3-3-2]
MGHHLAQLNIGRTLAPVDSDLLIGFTTMLDVVNDRAERSDGFVWRLQDDGIGNATSLRWPDDDTINVNMSTWTSVEALHAFVYGDREHRAVMRRRREWFEKLAIFQCLWWVPEGHRPTLLEAQERLTALEADGPTPYAFTFTTAFPAPDGPATDVRSFPDACPA